MSCLIKGGDYGQVVPSVKINGTVIDGEGVISQINASLAIKAIIIPYRVACFLGGMASIATSVQPAVDIASVTRGSVCRGRRGHVGSGRCIKPCFKPTNLTGLGNIRNYITRAEGGQLSSNFHSGGGTVN